MKSMRLKHHPCSILATVLLCAAGLTTARAASPRSIVFLNLLFVRVRAADDTKQNLVPQYRVRRQAVRTKEDAFARAAAHVDRADVERFLLEEPFLFCCLQNRKAGDRLAWITDDDFVDGCRGSRRTKMFSATVRFGARLNS